MSSFEEINVRYASDSDAGDWDQFVDSFDDVPPLCKYAWKHILSEQFEVETKFLLAVDKNKKIVGILPTYIVKNIRGEERLYSLHRGLLSSNKKSIQALLKKIKEINTERKLNDIQFSTPSKIEGYEGCLTIKKSLVLHLAPTIDDSWKDLRSKTRNMIRKSRMNHLVAERGNQNLREFYNIYTSRLLNIGVPIHNFSLLKNISEKFSNESELIVARLGNKVIGGIYIFFGKDCSMYPFQATIDGYKQLAVTQFLIWEACKRSLERGIRLIDMGESRLESPVYRSKLNFGGIPKDIYYYSSTQKNFSSSHQFKSETTTKNTKILYPLIHEYLVNNSPMWVRRKYGLWRRTQGRLLF